LRRVHDDRPARGVKARRTFRRRTMLAFHDKSPCFRILADQITFRNKIPETLEPGCLCNGMNTPDHEQKLQLDCTEKPGIQKTLDCHRDLRNLCGRSRQRSNLDDECFCGIAIFDLAYVNGGVASLFPVHTARASRKKRSRADSSPR
jgi:hypothetical protein